MKKEEIIKQAMAILGSRTSERKKFSSKRNGKLGGRPKKNDSKDIKTEVE